MLAPNTVDPGYVPSLPWVAEGDRGWAEWRINNGAGAATLIEPETKLGKIELPLAPMLGYCSPAAP